MLDALILNTLPLRDIFECNDFAVNLFEWNKELLIKGILLRIKIVSNSSRYGNLIILQSNNF